MNVRAKRELFEQQWEIKQREMDFWQPEDKNEAAGFLAVECVDDPQCAELLFDLCSLELKIENGDAILKAAKSLMLHLQTAISMHAANDKLPITAVRPDKHDLADSRFDDSLPFLPD